MSSCKMYVEEVNWNRCEFESRDRFQTWSVALSKCKIGEEASHIDKIYWVLGLDQEGRDSLNLEEFCRWFPSVLGLEPLSPQHIEESLGKLVTRFLILKSLWHFVLCYFWVEVWVQFVSSKQIIETLAEDQEWHEGTSRTGANRRICSSNLGKNYFTRQELPWESRFVRSDSSAHEYHAGTQEGAMACQIMRPSIDTFRLRCSFGFISADYANFLQAAVWQKCSDLVTWEILRICGGFSLGSRTNFDIQLLCTVLGHDSQVL